jgi:hypothetical protein
VYGTEIGNATRGASTRIWKRRPLDIHDNLADAVRFLSERPSHIDCDVAGSPYANLAVICCRRNSEANGSCGDQSTANPFLGVFCASHQTLPTAWSGLFRPETEV